MADLVQHAVTLPPRRRCIIHTVAGYRLRIVLGSAGSGPEWYTAVQGLSDTAQMSASSRCSALSSAALYVFFSPPLDFWGDTTDTPDENTPSNSRRARESSHSQQMHAYSRDIYIYIYIYIYMLPVIWRIRHSGECLGILENVWVIKLKSG